MFTPLDVIRPYLKHLKPQVTPQLNDNTILTEAVSHKLKINVRRH